MERPNVDDRGGDDVTTTLTASSSPSTRRRRRRTHGGERGEGGGGSGSGAEDKSEEEEEALNADRRRDRCKFVFPKLQVIMPWFTKIANIMQGWGSYFFIGTKLLLQLLSCEELQFQ